MLKDLFKKNKCSYNNTMSEEEQRQRNYDKWVLSHRYHISERDSDVSGMRIITSFSNDIGELSDGYHTFNQLYNYRMLYNAAFFNLLAKKKGYNVHKSKKHNDGKECFDGGWFIVMADLPSGQISNHYELKYWDLFKVPEKDVADLWDGHTPEDVETRLTEYIENMK